MSGRVLNTPPVSCIPAMQICQTATHKKFEINTEREFDAIFYWILKYTFFIYNSEKFIFVTF